MSVRIKEDKKVSIKKEIQEILLNKNRRIHAKEFGQISTVAWKPIYLRAIVLHSNISITE
jgi:hypothetical protein